MSNPLMRGVPGLSYNPYQPQPTGGYQNQGMNYSNTNQTYPPQPTEKGVSGIQIQYNPMDYSGYYGSPAPQ